VVVCFQIPTFDYSKTAHSDIVKFGLVFFQHLIALMLISKKCREIKNWKLPWKTATISNDRW